MKRVLYFAAGPPEQTVSDLERLRATREASSLLVIAPSAVAPQLAQCASFGDGEILACSPSSSVTLWIRLALLLAASRRSEIVCSRSSRPYRWLKLLALTLPGRLYIPDGKGTWTYCSRWQLWRAAVAAKGPLCVVGTASPERLRAIVANLRGRYPEARLHGVLLSPSHAAVHYLFDSSAGGSAAGAYLRLLPHCFGRHRFRGLVLPCAKEGFSARKCLAWMIPVWRIEAYNEYLDVFSGRNVFSLAHHLWWRTRENCLEKANHLRWLWWRTRENWREKRYNRQKAFASLPVSVVATASALSLKKIVPAVRAAFPGIELRGFLPAEAEQASRGLFDSTTILPPGLWSSLAQLWKSPRQRFQCCVIPCTNEPYAPLKLVAALAPLGPRHIYNELGDGFPLRRMGTFYRHILWRSRDHLSFQIVAGTQGKHLVSRCLHLVLYALRLLAGAAALAKVRLRAKLRERLRLGGESGRRSANRNTVDMIWLDSECDGSAYQRPPNVRNARIRSFVTLATSPASGADVHKINAAIRNGHAEFVCMLDSRCRMEGEDWLDRLIETFDAQTAQVGPQIVQLADGSAVRGGLLDPDRSPRWNGDHAVCWHKRPEWLQVDVLPWTCLVVRRSLFVKAGYFGYDSCREPLPVDLDFCRRLAAHGWRSICNQSVTASYPAGVTAGEMEPAGEISQSFRSSSNPAIAGGLSARLERGRP